MTITALFLQKILDRAAQRSRQLGISDTSKFPVTEFPTPATAAAEATPSAVVPKDQKNVVRFSSKKKPLTEDNNQQFDNISVEINITTDTNVGVSHSVLPGFSPSNSNKTFRPLPAPGKVRRNLDGRGRGRQRDEEAGAD